MMSLKLWTIFLYTDSEVTSSSFAMMNCRAFALTATSLTCLSLAFRSPNKMFSLILSLNKRGSYCTIAI